MSTLHPNLKARYLLDGNADNSAGAGLDGTPTNLTFAPGLGASVGVFDGSASIDLGRNFNFHGTAPFSVAAHIYVAAYPASGSYAIVNHDYYATNERAWRFILNSTGTLTFAMFPNGVSTGGVSRTTSATVPIGSLAYVAVTKSATTVTFYINGVSAGSAAAGSIFETTTATTQIGLLYDTWSFIGNIARVHIIDAALTEWDILRLARGQLPARAYL